MRPGETSRSAAISSRVSQSSLTTASARRPFTRCSPDVRRQGSVRCGGPAKSSSRSNSSRAQPSLPASASSASMIALSSASGSTSSAAYSSHGAGSGRVDQSTAECSLASRWCEQGLDERAQADAGVAQQPPGQLGVEERGGAQADLGEAGEILGRGVQDPLDAVECVVEVGEIVEGDGVDQGGAGPLAAKLYQVGALGVAVARGAFGVDGDRAGAGRERRDDLVERFLCLDNRWQPVTEARAGGVAPAPGQRSRSGRARS